MFHGYKYISEQLCVPFVVSTDFGASISEEPSIPALHSNIRQDQFGRTVIDLSESHEPSSSNSSKTSTGSTLPATNGVSNDVDANRSHSVYSNSNGDELNQTRDESFDLTRQENQAQENSEEVETKHLDHADRVSNSVCKNQN